MKVVKLFALVALCITSLSLPALAADVPGPDSTTMMTKSYVQTVGRMAYVWGYALVNSHNRRGGFELVTGKTATRMA